MTDPTRVRAVADLDRVIAMLRDLMTEEQRGELLILLACGGPVTTAALEELMAGGEGRTILRGLAVVGLCRLMGLEDDDGR